jgi:DNA repair exonuclease SbcCD ATPase subunit
MNEIPALTGTPEESIRFIVAGGEILRVDKQGIHYNGQTVADGGAAHDAWMATMKLMHSASFLGTIIAPQALREFVEWASEIFARYESLKPDAGDTPEVQEETAESIQRDRAYLSAFVATCEETSTRIDLEENQRKNNVAMDILSAKVDDLRKERDAAKRELAEMSAALDVGLKERTELRLQIDRWRSWPSTTDGEAKA